MAHFDRLLYVLDANGLPVKTVDGGHWARAMDDAAFNRIATTVLYQHEGDPRGRINLVTYFEGVNVGSPKQPLFFTTFATGRLVHLHWPLWEDALEGHRQVVADLADRGFRTRTNSERPPPTVQRRDVWQRLLDEQDPDPT